MTICEAISILLIGHNEALLVAPEKQAVGQRRVE